MGVPHTIQVERSIPTSRWRPMIWLAVAFYVPMAVLGAGIDWIALSQGILSSGGLIPPDVLTIGIAAFLTWLWYLSFPEERIEIDDEGLVVHLRRSRPGRPSAFRANWQELHSPVAEGGMILLHAAGVKRGFHLSYDQAKVVLTDGRYPMRGFLPDEVWYGRSIWPRSRRPAPEGAQLSHDHGGVPAGAGARDLGRRGRGGPGAGPDRPSGAPEGPRGDADRAR